MKHTKLPWARNPDPFWSDCNVIMAEGGTRAVGQVHFSGSGNFKRIDGVEARANSDFILRAVNAHYEMHQALQVVRLDPRIWDHIDPRAKQQITEALAKAEGY